MLSKRKRDASDKASPKNTLQSGSYQTCAPESTVNLEIGEFLLYLCASGSRSRSLYEHLAAELRGGML